MKLSQKSLDNLESHWAVSGIRGDCAEKVSRLVCQKTAQSAFGEQISFKFKNSRNDETLLENASVSYELAMLEGLSELTRTVGENESLIEQAVLGSRMAYEIRRLETVPEEDDDRLYFVLKLSALAYCGGKWADLRCWYNDNEHTLHVPNDTKLPWDEYLKLRIFDCWLRLFRQNSRKNLEEIGEIILDLRKKQKVMQSKFIAEVESSDEKNYVTILLAPLYNFARSTEVVAQYMLNGEVDRHGSDRLNPFSTIERHFEAAVKAADSLREPQLVTVLKFLHAAANIMVSNSLWWTMGKFSPQASKLVETLTHRKRQAIFGLLPHQKSALFEQGLLDPLKRVTIVDLPPASETALLAEFRILQELNRFQSERGWIAYVAPTGALAARITRNLKTDLEATGARIEKLEDSTGFCPFEENLLMEKNDQLTYLLQLLKNCHC